MIPDKVLVQYKCVCPSCGHDAASVLSSAQILPDGRIDVSSKPDEDSSDIRCKKCLEREREQLNAERRLQRQQAKWRDRKGGRGPLDDDGKPCPKRKGTTFRSWTGKLRELGYAVQWKELRACDYGAPTIRKRLFLVARCDGLPIVWPEVTHGDITSDEIGYSRGLHRGPGQRRSTSSTKPLVQGDVSEAGQTDVPPRIQPRLRLLDMAGESREKRCVQNLHAASDARRVRRRSKLKTYRTAAECIDWSIPQLQRTDRIRVTDSRQGIARRNGGRLMEPTLFHNTAIAGDIEQDAKRQALDQHEQRRGYWLKWLRSEMRSLYYRRLAIDGADAFVTADDARKLLEDRADVPPADQLNRNFMGSLFQTKDWRSTGRMIKSKTPGSHANRLMCWKHVPKGEYAMTHMHVPDTLLKPCHALDVPLRQKKSTKYCVGDLFRQDVPFDFIDRVFAVMALCPQHTFQVLTKRPERMVEYLNQHSMRGRIYDSDVWQNSKVNPNPEPVNWPLPNVWLGTSVEDQVTADARIPHLLRCPAAVRFLSCEPLLGAVDLRAIEQTVAPGFFGDCLQWYHRGACHKQEGIEYPTIHWVIVGGESGPNARPMHPDWARNIRDQCAAAGVAFFFKQWGEYIPFEHDAQPPFLSSQNGEYIDGHALPDFDSDQPQGPWIMDDYCEVYKRVGKKAAGRLLDGVEHNELPTREVANVSE